jgi:tryptophanyl-tRNA synthetase
MFVTLAVWWLCPQDLYDTFFFVVDLHAITLAHNAEELARATRTSAAIYIACGIDPSKVTGSRTD